MIISNIIDTKFYDNIYHINKTLFYRRIINIHYNYFKNNNHILTINNTDVINHINTLVNHYVSYFISLYKIKPLSDKHRLVPHVFKNKWVKQSRHHIEINSDIYTKYLYPINPIFNNDTYMFYLEGQNYILSYF